jgi:hypothetical protein
MTLACHHCAHPNKLEAFISDPKITYGGCNHPFAFESASKNLLHTDTEEAAWIASALNRYLRT